MSEDPEEMAAFQAFCEEREREAQQRTLENEAKNQKGYVITFFVGLAFSVFVIIGIILGWFSPGYIVYVIADAIVSVKLSDKIRGFFRRK